jgi:hypothetical protein
LLITALVALVLAAGGALAAPNALDLPLPISTSISVPTAAAAFDDNTSVLELSPGLHLFSGQAGLPHDFFRLSPAFAAPTPDSAAPLALQMPELPREYSSSAALQWDVSKWAALQLTAVNGTGSSGLLGDYAPPPLAFANNLQTSSAGLSAHVTLGAGWVTSFSYNVNISRLDLKAGGTADLGTSTTHGDSYSVSVAKRGLFGSADSLGLSVSRPSEDYFGGISLTDADAGLENRIDLMRNYRSIALSDSKETDIALGYVTSFFHGALALQANAGYQMNANGQNGANGVTVLSRAKINF